jgi:cobalt-zinc-cadmium efflux system outer membrane protein
MAAIREQSLIRQARTVRRTGVAWFGAFLPLFCLGCLGQFTEANRPEPAPQQVRSQAPSAPAVPSSSPRETIQRAGYQEKSENGGQDKKEGNGGEKQETPKEKISLPQAIQMCITENFRIVAGAEKVRQAEAELVTASLIPNPTLFTDYQLIPLQHVDIDNQLGPPQADALVTVPIDWLIFGKRVAQMQAARLGIDVSNADYADLHRVQVGRTVDAFYEVLADDAYLKLAEKNLEELQEIEKLTIELQKNKKVGTLERDRVKLAVHEALLEKHDRELALELAKARLRPFIGRTAADPDYEVDGVLTVTAVVPVPKLEEVVALAEAHRPDLISDLYDIARAQANVKLERRRARPRVEIIPGYTYQNQHYINGFPNGGLFDIGIFTTLPITDRNQGNILKARSLEREAYKIYKVDRADALAEAEAARASYEDAVEHLTQFNTPSTLKAAYDLRANMEAAYRAGTRGLQEFLLAHQAYRDRLAHVIEFESTYWRTLNSLNVAVGLNAYDQDTRATQRVRYDNGKKQ